MTVTVASEIETVHVRFPDLSILDPSRPIDERHSLWSVIGLFERRVNERPTEGLKIIQASSREGQSYPSFLRVSGKYGHDRPTIYALVDSLNGEVFYVGQALDVNKRFHLHAREPYSGDYKRLPSNLRKLAIAETGGFVDGVVLCHAPDVPTGAFLEYFAMRVFHSSLLNAKLYRTHSMAYRRSHRQW
jgi:hypothetical protein